MPKVLIKYNKVIDPVTKAYCLTLPKFSNRAARDTDINVVNDQIEIYKKAWFPIEQKVFDAISNKARRTFPYSVVNVSVVWVTHRTEAHSMIIPCSLPVIDFIITLTHELIHLSWYFETAEYKELYKNETVSARQHIIVHAILEYIWRDVLEKPEYVDLYKEKCARHSTDDYMRAWEIVEQVGYNSILDQYIKDPNNNDAVQTTKAP